MTLPRFLLFAAASLLLLNSTATAQEGPTVTVKKENACLEKMNEARVAARLQKFKSGTFDEVPKDKDSPDGVWAKVCKTLLDSDKFEPEKDDEGTYALFKLSKITEQEGQAMVDDSQCSAAVQQWQEGFSEFEESSPAETEVQYEGAGSKKVSFVTLYNSHEDAASHCWVATCTKTNSLPDSGETKVSGLVCYTKPNAFDEQTLFSQDDWNNIREALKEPKEEEREVTIADGNNCLTKLNVARNEAGLENLVPKEAVKANATESKTPQGVFAAVCDHLIDGKEFKPSDDLVSSETYALSKLSEVPSVANKETTPTESQCSAAVEKWQEGFKTFEQDPPVDKSVDYSKASSTQVSFVTVYNPDSEAKGKCVVASCTGTPKEQASTRGSKPTKTTASALVCSTDPNAFKKTSLFTQDQWNKIKAVFSNSGLVAVPSVLALATVLAGAFLS